MNTTGQTLTNELANELNKIRNEKAFDPEIFANKRTEEFLKYLEKYNIGTTVLSVSGGIDSAVVLGLLKKAQEQANLNPTHPYNIANGGKIIALAQPIFSTPQIQNRAYELGEKFNIRINTIRQDKIHAQINELIANEFGQPLNNFASSMLKSYMRTPTAFAIAQNFNGVVIGTGNLDEDGYLYYYCKFGDGAVDIGLIWDLHKSEVFKLGEFLQIPQSILDAPPSADLFPNQTDQNEIGISYDSIELIYNYQKVFTTEQQENFKNSLDEESLEQFEREKNIAEKIHIRGLHKSDLNPKNIGNVLI